MSLNLDAVTTAQEHHLKSPPPAIADTIQRFRSLLATYTGTNEQLQRIANRVIHGCDTLPNASGSVAEKPHRSGLVGGFEDLADELQQQIEQTNVLLAQLGEHI